MQEIVQRMLDAEREAASLVTKAEIEARKVLDEARGEAEQILNQASHETALEARTLVDTARHEATLQREEEVSQALADLDDRLKAFDAKRDEVVKRMAQAVLA